MQGAEVKVSDIKKAAGEHNLHETSQREIRAMLFADVFKYSLLVDEQVPLFVREFLGLIASLIEGSDFKPVTRNTWGDALYFAFETVRSAGNFALELKDLLSTTKWQEKGMPAELSLRISLHAGPVYWIEDPVIKKHKYTGSHVNRTARIEPITPPGEVYASQEFAAIAAAQKIEEFTCEYVGSAPLPKNEKIIPLYFVKRKPGFKSLSCMQR